MKDAQCFIANGVVVSLEALKKETEALESRGVDVRSRLGISPACPVIMPYHELLDHARKRPRVIMPLARPVVELVRPMKTRYHAGVSGYQI